MMEWSKCDSSSSTDVELYEKSWFEETADQTSYWLGGEIEHDTKDYCPGDVLFAKNEIAQSLFDIAVSYAANSSMGKAPAQAKKSLKRNKMKAAAA